MPEHEISVRINETTYSRRVEARRTLADFIRDECGLTGLHLGCEHGSCGACTIHLEGEAVRACLLFAVQADGAEITTVEGLAPPGKLNLVQQAFQDNHGLQCGFCTPGFVMSLTAFLRDTPDPSEDDIFEALSGNLCRCTGYQGIVKAVRQASGQEGRA